MYQALYRYLLGRSEATPVPRYKLQAVQIAVDLDRNGNLLRIVDLKADGQDGPKVMAPFFVRGNQTGRKREGCLFYGDIEYLLGISFADAPVELDFKLDASRRLMQQCASDTGDPSAMAVASFLASWHPSSLDAFGYQPENTKGKKAAKNASKKVAFRVDGAWAFDAEPIRSWWKNYQDGNTKKKGTEKYGMCSITGEWGRILQRVPVTIEPFGPNAINQVKLFAVNSPAFENYGLDAAYNSPVIDSVAERLGVGLQRLMKDPAHSIRFGDVTYVFWADGEATRAAWDADPLWVARLLNSPRHPYAPADGEPVEEVAMYALQQRKTRLIVCSGELMPMMQFHNHLRDWFECQKSITGGEVYGIVRLISSLKDSKKQKVEESPFREEIIAAAYLAEPMTERLLTRIYQILLKGNFRQEHLVLLALYLFLKGYPMLADRESETNVGFVMGRKARVLKELQLRAIPNISTPFDRHIGALLEYPATTMVELEAVGLYHLDKLRRKRSRFHWPLRRAMTKLNERLSAYPNYFDDTLRAQFLLGYQYEDTHHKLVAAKD